MLGRLQVRAPHRPYRWAIAALLLGGAGCSSGPSATGPVASQTQINHARFAGAWTTQLPQGRLVLIYVEHPGSVISGTITNFGPIIAGLDFPIRGTVDGAAVNLYFMYPVGLAEGTADLPVAWSFHGTFTGVSTVEGTISSETGLTARIVINKDTEPVPLAVSN